MNPERAILPDHELLFERPMPELLVNNQKHLYTPKFEDLNIKNVQFCQFFYVNKNLYIYLVYYKNLLS